MVHPFPSLLNAALVLALAMAAGAGPVAAAVLALSMLLLQFCIGTANDICDEPVDRLTRPSKALPAGLISRRAAIAVAFVAGGGGLLLAALPGPVVLFIAVAGLAAGLAYDLWLKRTRWAWACFSVALPLLPMFAWYGAAGALPPRAEVLLPLAALAGPALQLANGLVDIDRDRAAHLNTLPVLLGQRRGRALMVVLFLVIHALVWILLAGAAVSAPMLLARLTAGGLALGGAALSGAPAATAREWGWRMQATATALLALAWLLAVS